MSLLLVYTTVLTFWFVSVGMYASYPSATVTM